MGYSTDFEGRLTFDKPLNRQQTDYINLLAGTRRMKRDPAILQEMYKGKYGLLGGPDYGYDGEYFAKDDGDFGQKHDKSIIDYNEPPGAQPIGKGNFMLGFNKQEKRIKDGKQVPGLWLKWEISDDGATLKWDGSEKFYYYVEWLQYLIDRFFTPWGYKLNGEITWEGEDSTDMGKIQVKDSKVTVKRAKIIYE
jgi:hypothetical protein